MAIEISGNKIFVSVKGFKGVNEFQSPESISDSELTKLENATLDKSGGDIVSRSGFNSYNTYNANTIPNAYGIISLFETIINSVEYVVAIIGTELKTFAKNATSWVTQQTNLTIGKVMRAVQYTNKLYVTNGTEPPFIVDVSGTSPNVFVGIAQPDVSVSNITTFTPITSGGAIQYRGGFDASFGLFPANGMIAAISIHTAGTGYTIGSILNIVGGAGGAQLKVMQVGAGGSISSVSIIAQGIGYAPATNVATTGGGNNDFTLDITQTITGSGTAGAIAQNDSWQITTAGTLGSDTIVKADNRILALTSVPGQIDANWTTMAMEYGGRLYAFVYEDSDGNVSHSSYPAYVAVTGAINAVKITNVPVASVKTKIYRSMIDSGTLYLLDIVTSGNATYYDTHSDADLHTDDVLSDSDTSLPATAQYPLIKDDRLFFAGVGFQDSGNNTDAINGSGMYVDIVSGVAVGLELSSTYKYARTYNFSDGSRSKIVKEFASISTGTPGTKAQIAIDMWFPVTASASGVVGSKFNILFASTQTLNGLLSSIDNGATWSRVGGFSTRTINDILKIGTNIYIATDGGIFVSTDYGVNFNAINSGITNTNVLSLLYDGTYLYAGCYGVSDNAYRSNNLGTSWTAIPNTNNFSPEFVVLGGSLFSYSPLYFGSPAAIYYSVNNGSTWTVCADTGLPINGVWSLIAQGSNLYAAIEAQGVYKSSNNGSNWTSVSSGITNPNVRSLYSDGTNIYAGATDAKIFKSPNNGVSWSDVSIPSFTGHVVSSLYSIGTRLFAGLYDGTWNGFVYFSDTQGASWSICETPSIINTSPSASGVLIKIAKPDSQFTPDYFVTGSYFNSDITSATIWRTKANGSTYYSLETIVKASWDTAMRNGFTDVIPDATLGTGIYTVYSDPSATVTNYGSRIVWSNNAELQTFPALNFIEVSPDDGEVITGVAEETNGVLIYKTNSIYKLYTIGDSANWVLQKLVSSCGCSEPNSLAITPRGNFFVHNGTIWLHAGESKEPVIVSTKYRDTIASITAYMQASYNSLNEWVVFPVMVGALNYMIIYDIKMETWYKFSIPFTSITQWAALSRRIGSDADKILITGSIDGMMGFYDTTLNTGSDVYPSATAYITTLQTKTFDFPEGVGLIRPRKLWINENVKSGASLTHTLVEADSGVSVSTTETGMSTQSYVNSIVTDSMSTTYGIKLTSINKFYYILSGTLLGRFLGMKLDGIVLNRGRRG
jgi:hypothetical protein